MHWESNLWHHALFLELIFQWCMTSICMFTYNYTRHIHIKQIICIFSPILCIFKNLVWLKGNVENCSWWFIAHEIKSQVNNVLLWYTIFCTVCSQILFHEYIKSAVHVHFAAELVIATVSLSSKVILIRKDGHIVHINQFEYIKSCTKIIKIFIEMICRV